MVQYSKFSTNYKLTKGRVYKEDSDLNRTCFMRDRDRIIHSSAFRRLKYKTQVFVHHEQDYYRTRLSHSLEVSQLARSISKIFRVNDDLAESISLSHDLGLFRTSSVRSTQTSSSPDHAGFTIWNPPTRSLRLSKPDAYAGLGGYTFHPSTVESAAVSQPCCVVCKRG